MKNRIDLENEDVPENKEKSDAESFVDETEDENWNKMTEEKMNALIESKVNFFLFGPKITRMISDYLKERLLQTDIEVDNKIMMDFNLLYNREKELKLLLDSYEIQKKKIVAMTTSGCAKNSTILETCNFEVIIIEEAAEVLEPHILSLFTRHTKHLIMIGDHKQLKPKPYNFELEVKYNFNVSMFERLINNGFPGFVSLAFQRRMKPLFADFVRIIYGEEKYIDHESVQNSEEVKGMATNMFFIDHRYSEETEKGLQSKSNSYECNFLIRLCEYLMKQGYKSNQITILTFYVGQVLKMRKMIKARKNEKLKNVRVCSVDNYQGEECDIILLSLVRSNKNNEIGFLRSFNRVCVSFSRAKLGFYIIGNIDCLVKGEQQLQKRKNNKEIIVKEDSKMDDVWYKIYTKLTNNKLISETLTLKCYNHKNETIIKNYEDFAKFPEGGCLQKCNIKMKCGHVCERNCHIVPYQDGKIHDDMVKCYKKCPKELKCGHICSNKCYVCKEKGTCEPCETLIKEMKLECGHIKKDVKCSCDKTSIICMEKCERTLKCGHKCPLKCHEKCGKCTALIKIKLNCGHIQDIQCGSDPKFFVCQEKCNATLKCGHKCYGTCGECLSGTLHKKCLHQCGKALFCGHICKMNCSSQCLCKEKCVNICFHGYCDDKCCEECVPCKEQCTIGCRHSKCTGYCGDLCERDPCIFRCEKKKDCGHRCIGLCGERCPKVCRECDPKNECFEIMFGREQEEDALFYELKCGHAFEYRDLDMYFEVNSKQIKTFNCPKCKNILLDEPRYQNYIKQAFLDCYKVKKVYLERVAGKENDYHKKSSEIIEDVKKQLNENKIKVFERMNRGFLVDIGIKYTKYVQMSKYLEYTSKCVKKFTESSLESKYITTYNLLTLLNKFIGVEYYAQEIQKSQNLTPNSILYIKNYNIIKEYFIDNRIC